MKVLIVEDEVKIASFLERGLKEAGFNVVVEHDGDEGYHLARTEEFDVIVLDIMLPGRDGLSILKQLRVQRNSVPVIILTARGELDEKLMGLDLGADDYLTKPFYIEELIARVHGGDLVLEESGEGLNLFVLRLRTASPKAGTTC